MEFEFFPFWLLVFPLLLPRTSAFFSLLMPETEVDFPEDAVLEISSSDNVDLDFPLEVVDFVGLADVFPFEALLEVVLFDFLVAMAKTFLFCVKK
jgi:hypothetical protein